MNFWGFPVVVSPQIGAGESWVGDWSTIGLGIRGALELTMTDQGVYEQTAEDPEEEPTLIDPHERNLLRGRDEHRAVFKFLQPAAMTKVDLTACPQDPAGLDA